MHYPILHMNYILTWKQLWAHCSPPLPLLQGRFHSCLLCKLHYMMIHCNEL